MTKKNDNNEFPPALVALAERIEETAQINAEKLYSRVEARLTGIQQHTGASLEVMRAALDIMGSAQEDKAGSAKGHPVFVGFARQEIINKLVKEEGRNELQDR